MKLPDFWKNNLKDIDEIVASVKKGRVTTSYSAGGRPVYLVEYGTPNDHSYRTANFNSAAGVHDITCYVDKSREDVKPSAFIIGAMHGGEFEGTVGILNLISLIETGVDLGGMPNPAFDGIEEKMHILLMPCANPDGRARVPVDSYQEMSAEEFRYYAQGTWKDGTLANWPQCKKVHPIKDASDFLGSYFNDDGVNLMHDDFFEPLSETTRFIMDTLDKYVPDVTCLLHGGSGSKQHILNPNFVPFYYREEVHKLMLHLSARLRANGLEMAETGLNAIETDQNNTMFNAVSAYIAKCGTLCFTYESNQGIGGEKLCYTPEVIYKHHMFLFEEIFEYAKRYIERLQYKK